MCVSEYFWIFGAAVATAEGVKVDLNRWPLTAPALSLAEAPRRSRAKL